MSEKSRKKRFFLRWQFFALLFIFAAIAAAAIYFGPGRPYIRSWRAGSQLELARDLAASEEWEAVSSHARESVKLAPSLEGVRLVAKSAYHTGSPEVLAAAWKLFRYEGATLEDRSWALKLVSDFNDRKTAKVMSEQLTDEERRHAPIRYQLVRGLLLQENFREALTLADQEDLPKDPALDLLLAASFAKNGILEARAETSLRLRKVLECEDRDLALQALPVVASLNNQWLEPSLAKAAIERFRDDPALGASNRLQLTTLKLRTGVAAVEESVEEAISRYRESDLEVLVRWLFKIGQFDRILAITSGEEAQKMEEVFLIRLYVLIQTEDWESLQAELEDPPVRIPRPLSLGFEALGLKMQGKNPKALAKWQKAFESAENDEKKNWFYELSKIATRLENEDGRMKSLMSAIDRRDRVPPPAKSLVPVFAWLVEKGDQKGVLRLSENLLLHEPANPTLLNNFHYLKAIYREPDHEDLKTMEKLIARYPNQQNFWHTLAMIQLQLDENRKAIETIRSIPVTIPESPNSERAIRARAQFDLGNEEEARSLAKTIDYDEFSTREAEVLKLPEPEENKPPSEANKSEEDSD